MEMDQTNGTVNTPPTAEGSPSSSRSRDPSQTSTPGPITMRYNYDVNRFRGGPETPLGEDDGFLKPVHNRDIRKSPSSDASSAVHKIEDLGFSAAVATFNFETLKKEALCALKQIPEVACVEATLRKRFETSVTFNTPDAKEYLPLDEFRKIYNPTSIIWLLKERFPDNLEDDLLDKFYKIISPDRENSRTRILGILVAMEGLHRLEEFIKRDIWDRDLPFKESREYTEKSSILEGWTRNERLLFYGNQKVICIPFFDIQENRLCAYELEHGTRLPWVSLEQKSTGGTGVVHQLEIHPSHHNFRKPGSDANPKFALKEIDASEQHAYRKELHALEKTCAHVQKEKHLIKLLLTFQHGNTFYLLFEWADGNLQQFWESNPNMEHSLSNEIWAARQCLGLAKAVSRIHGLSSWHQRGREEERSDSIASQKEDECVWGRHGDIKPDNILWFEEYGDCGRHLVISDLGLARYHTEFSKSLVPRALIDGITWGYRAPEIDFGSSISPGYDIFSLGCVFLEFCIWYLHGVNEVETFGLQRSDEDRPTLDYVRKDQFFCMTGNCNSVKGASLKKCVTERLTEMKSRNDSKFIQGMASVIEDRMLCCDPAKRSKIDLICTDLHALVAKLTMPSTALERLQDLAFTSSNPNLSTPLDRNNILDGYPPNLTLDGPEEALSLEERDVIGARPSQSGHERNDSHGDYDSITSETNPTPVTVPDPVTKGEKLQTEIQEVSVTPSSHSMVEPQSTQQQSVDVSGNAVERNRRSSTTMFKHARKKSKQWVRGALDNIKNIHR